MPHSRSAPSIGRYVHELNIRDADATWRVVYRLDPDAVVIVSVFSRKTQATPASVIRNCQRRLAAYDAIEYRTTMKTPKLIRRRAAGWKVGGVRESLDLSDEDVALIELKLVFADVIRQTRQRRAMTQTRLAELIGSSQSRVARMEAGDASVSLDLMFRTAFNLGLSASEVSRRISKPRRSRGASKKAG